MMIPIKRCQPFQVTWTSRESGSKKSLINLPGSLDLKDHASICLHWIGLDDWLMERNFLDTMIYFCLLVNQ